MKKDVHLAARRAETLRTALDHITKALELYLGTGYNFTTSFDALPALREAYSKLESRLRVEEQAVLSGVNAVTDCKVEVFVFDGVTTFETCPECKLPLIKVEHGHMAYVGGPDFPERTRAYKHCPECGDQIVIVDPDKSPVGPGHKENDE